MRRLGTALVAAMVAATVAWQPATAETSDEPAEGESTTTFDSAEEMPPVSPDLLPEEGTDRIIVEFASPITGLAPGVEAPVHGVIRSGRAEQKRPDVSAISHRTALGSWVVDLPSELNPVEVQQVADFWATQPGVISAQPDWRMFASDTPNDMLYGEQWHLHEVSATNYGANLPPAWGLAPAAGDVTVAVLDTGILPHEDIVDQLLPGYDFISDPWVSVDGDGRDPDPTDPGDICPTDRYPESSWHGLHVAGTIGASTNNDIGVAGVAPNASIVPVRVLGRCGGYTSDIVDGMIWAAGGSVTGVPANANPARVLNLSLGTRGGGCLPEEQKAIDKVRELGALVVVAAGNDNQSAVSASPAGCKGVLAVANTDPSGKRNPSSNFGSNVALAAPGTAVLSTGDSGHSTAAGPTYTTMSGTSMAAPHVAGVAALLLGEQPALSHDEIIALLRATATPFPAASGCAGVCGTGILNAGNAMAALKGLETGIDLRPQAPTEVRVTAASATSATVAWEMPRGSALGVNFEINVRNLRNGSTMVLAAPVTTDGVLASGLITGDPYAFSVTGIDALGSRSVSAETAPAIPPFTDVESFVARQFEAFADRAPTDEELTRWDDHFSHQGGRGADLIEELSASGPWGTSTDPVTRLYLTYFDRTPDTQGLTHWSSAMRSGTSLKAISAGFARSPEFALHYAGTTDGEFVSRVYQNVLGRTADGSGRDYWVGRLSEGTSRSDIVTEMSESKENRYRTQSMVSIVNITFAMLERVPTSDDLPPSGRRAIHVTARQTLASDDYRTTISKTD